MYISKKLKEKVKMKYGGLCAYSGTKLEADWQVDHIKPVVRNWWDNTAMFGDNHVFKNMVPVQNIINHYKHSMGIEEYRERLMGLHERLKKLPKNPRTENGRKRKAYMLKVAGYFGITPENPFDGVFYFETLNEINERKTSKQRY